MYWLFLRAIFCSSELAHGTDSTNSHYWTLALCNLIPRSISVSDSDFLHHCSKGIYCWQPHYRLLAN